MKDDFTSVEDVANLVYHNRSNAIKKISDLQSTCQAYIESQETKKKNASNCAYNSPETLIQWWFKGPTKSFE